jgi:anaphase-promoting complex subunit 3
VEIEEFESAKKCYTEALRTNSRHYTAWWGLGNIHQKQEKYEQASYNLQQAISINSRSAILHTYLGMTFHNQNMLEDACKCFDMANQINPSNILNKYQKS